MRLEVFETDIILAQVALLEANEAAEVRGRERGVRAPRHRLVRASTDSPSR